MYKTYRNSFNTSHVVVYPIGILYMILYLWGFNTSHVVVYPRTFLCLLRITAVSIHLMLQFISRSGITICIWMIVSIHLMLQFISLCLQSHNYYPLFQYISCCSLSMMDKQIVCEIEKFQYISCCSLSMLFLSDMKYSIKFQYISCCSLSIRLQNFQIHSYSFNTSHVVVYPYLPFNKIPLEMFQYISCCSLSC